MTARPIIFSAPMVRALLEGRKTQTRRVVKIAGRLPEYIGPRGCEDDPKCWGWEVDGGYVLLGDEKGALSWSGMRSSYRAGDRLWVREHHARTEFDTRFNMPYAPPHYYADGPLSLDLRHDAGLLRSHPSIHMPRWASRLTLTVTDVRVQRLQDITPADAIAEGFPAYANSITIDCDTPSPRDDFSSFWNSIHGQDAWDKNPWVAALTFAVCKGNIDA